MELPFTEFFNILELRKCVKGFKMTEQFHCTLWNIQLKHFMQLLPLWLTFTKGLYGLSLSIKRHSLME